MATSMGKARQAKRAAFDKATNLLRYGPGKQSQARQRELTTQFAQAAGQPLGAVSQAVAASNLGGQRMPGQQSPMDIASQAADKRQQATALAAQQSQAENQAMMEQAKKTVDDEMKARRERRAKALAIGASLALPAAGPLAGALGGVAQRAAEGSFKRNLAGGAQQYLQNLQAMYSGSNDDDDGES